MAAAVALLITLGASALVWSAFTGDGARRPAVPTPTEDPFAGLGAGWTELSSFRATESVRDGAAVAWTGSRVLVWGGSVYSDASGDRWINDGYSLDPSTGVSTRLPNAPIAPRFRPAAAWSGHELLVWGGLDDQGKPLSDGAAYNPSTETWRMLPDAPIDARAPLSVWTGEELIVWGTSVRTVDRPRDGAVYTPQTDSWRTIPDAPIELTDGSAAWTGREMLVFGAALNGGNHAETASAIGAAYDPSTETWRTLPNSGLSPQASSAAWNGSELIASDYLSGSAAYEPMSDRWRQLEDVPIDPVECGPENVAAETWVVSQVCGAVVTIGQGEDHWRSDPLNQHDPFGPLLLVPAGRSTIALSGEPDGDRARAFVWRPPKSPSRSESVDDGSAELQPSRVEIPEPSGQATLAAETRIPPSVTSLIYGNGSVWVFSALNAQGNQIHRLDPQTLEETATIQTEGLIGWETGGGGLAFQGDSLWMFGDGRLQGDSPGPILERIDTSSNRVVETIQIPSERNQHAADIAIADSGIWLTLLSGTDTGAEVVRVDPTTHQIVARIPLESGYAREIIATDDAVLVQERIWSHDQERLAAESVLDTIDPATNGVVARVLAYELGVGLDQPVLWDNQVWAGSSSSSHAGLVRVDPATAAPSEFVKLLAPGCCGTALGPGGIWFTTEGGGTHLLGIFDPDSGEIAAVYDAPRDAIGIDAAASEDGMYFLDYDGFVRRYMVG